jgi:hypothetical protein
MVAFEEEQYGGLAMEDALDDLFSSSRSFKGPCADPGEASEFIYTR